MQVFQHLLTEPAHEKKLRDPLAELFAVRELAV
jgi:hypothetical protein